MARLQGGCGRRVRVVALGMLGMSCSGGLENFQTYIVFLG